MEFIWTYKGYKEIIEVLLSNNATSDLQDDDGETALHSAAGNGTNIQL